MICLNNTKSNFAVIDNFGKPESPMSLSLCEKSSIKNEITLPGGCSTWKECSLEAQTGYSFDDSGLMLIAPSEQIVALGVYLIKI